MARRSGVAPGCAKRATLLACLLFAACLNPMPEEFPSNEGTTIGLDPSAAGGGAGASGTPFLPGSGEATGPDLVDEAATPEGGGAGTGSSPATSEPPSAGDGTEEEPGVPDAGADAATPTGDDPDSAGETAP